LPVLTANKAATNNKQTAVFNNAFANAKMCLSKGNSTTKVNLLKKVTATNTTTEKIPINNFACLSFFLNIYL
jgi:hypothetical protein